LPAAREIVVHSDGTIAALLLVTPRGEEVEALLRRGDQGWTIDNAERLIQVGTRRPITLFSAEAVPADLVIEDDPHAILEFPPITTDLAQPFADALGVLEHLAPEYMSWVDRVLRAVLVCRCCERRTRSASWVQAPGVALMSASDNPIALAEMMVHESSHQYCHIASRLGPTIEGGDAQPEHPLNEILTEYHALGNMLLFYRTLLWNGLSDPYCTERAARLASDVDALAALLRDRSPLTAIGRDLFEPLHEQVGALR
ncbi:MAG TPA: HEXXH motif-containing putative peptide modification protein, partial [Kofleriaceae bacterium]|nr:HEXXH motif-containing putative peptide modification protein [Kofleriaceae bacterium]